MVQARDASAIFWNPAILSGFRDRELLISINDPFEFNFVGMTQFVPLYGTLGVALSRIPGDDDDVDRGTFAWGFKMLERFSLGANLSIARQEKDWFAQGSAGIFLGNPGIGALGRRWRQIPTSQVLDRLNLGLTVHNIPIGSSLFDPSANLGMSYLFPGPGLLINTGHHIRNGEDTSHLGLGLELFQSVTVFGGIEELDFDKAAIGLSYTHDNFLFNLAYSADSERLILTFAARISPSPSALAKPYYDRGYRYLRRGDFRSAIREMRKYLSFELAGTESDTTTKELLNRLQTKVARDQIVIDSLYVYANRMIANGEPMRATLSLMRILELDSTNVKAREKLGHLKPAIDSYISKYLAEGTSQFEAKQYAEARSSFSRVLILEKKNQTALNYLNLIEQLSAELGDEHFYRGLGFFRQKDYLRAMDEFEQALQFKPDLAEAESYRKRAREKLIETRNQIQRLLTAGSDLERKGRHLDATNQYVEVLQLDPDNETARLRIDNLRPRVELFIQGKLDEGATFLKNENFVKARQSFSTVLSIDPNHKDAKSYMVRLRNAIGDRISQYLAQADDYMLRGDWANASESYARVLSLDPQNNRANQGKLEAQTQSEIASLMTRGQQEIEANNILEGIAMFERALKNDPSNEKTRAALKAARDKLKEKVEALFLEGISLYTNDRYQDAIKKWEEVLRLDANHKGALEYKQQADERIRALQKFKR